MNLVFSIVYTNTMKSSFGYLTYKSGFNIIEFGKKKLFFCNVNLNAALCGFTYLDGILIWNTFENERSKI